MNDKLFYCTLLILFSSSVQPDSDRIFGGDDTKIEAHPYQVAVRNGTNHQCGGSIIKPSVIITAAHCTYKITDLNSFKIRAGTTNTFEGGVLHDIQKIINHEKWDVSTGDYDVSLILLKEPLPLSDKIKEIPLPDQNEKLSGGEEAVITGWGLIKKGECVVPPLELQKAVIHIVSQETCSPHFTGDKKITPRMLCAGNTADDGKGMCMGDSGGPLVSDGKLHGIVSFGGGCADKTKPGVFTRVTEILDWIREKTKN